MLGMPSLKWGTVPLGCTVSTGDVDLKSFSNINCSETTGLKEKHIRGPYVWIIYCNCTMIIS